MKKEVYVCDGCGADDIGRFYFWRKSPRLRVHVGTTYNPTATEQIDLCPDCMAKMADCAINCLAEETRSRIITSRRAGGSW